MDQVTSVDTAIAVIGQSCRFPMAQTPDEFWQNLRSGRECITRFSLEELLAEGCSAAELDDPAYVPAKGWVAGVEMFDADLFGYSPREAEILDPRCRLLLECAWEALESAGYLDTTADVGAFFGVGSSLIDGPAALSSYYFRNLHTNSNLRRALSGFSLALACDEGLFAAQVAYRLNLTGPCLGVQSACSSSLVAVHLASQSLVSGECDLALAGGVALTCPRKSGYWYRPGLTLSPDGHCRAFDAHAQGTVPGEGAGLVLLKRLSDALADGDPIDAVLLSSALNNDGRQKVGFTAPGVPGQRSLCAQAFTLADVLPETLTYVEAHGTGTRLGDPVEIEALTGAFRTQTTACGFCGIGSVKSNLGHLDAAAGIAGLIKTILALRHGEIPPSLHVSQPNPLIPFHRSPFFVVSSLTPWVTSGYSRRAVVNSFGIGGTNACVVLEQPPSRLNEPQQQTGEQLLLSAHSEWSLAQLCAGLAQYLRKHPELRLTDVAFTLATGRRHLRLRTVVFANNGTEAAEKLEFLSHQLHVSGKLPAIAELTKNDSTSVNQEIVEWLSGAPSERLQARGDHFRRRVHLPTYPFDRKRFWISATSHPQATDR